MINLGESHKCFGKLWEASAPECLGGYDPTYSDKEAPHGRENMRPKCDLYHACGAQKASNAVSRTVDVPLHRLHTAPVHVGPSTTTARPGFLQNYPPVSTNQPVPNRGYLPQQYASAPIVNNELVHVKPVELVPANWYTVPSILSEPEPVTSFDFKSVAITAGRGAAVGALMALAHYVSYAPFRRG